MHAVIDSTQNKPNFNHTSSTLTHSPEEFVALTNLLWSSSASEDSVLKDSGISADDATGRSLQEVHGAAGQREVQPRQSGE